MNEAMNDDIILVTRVLTAAGPVVMLPDEIDGVFVKITETVSRAAAKRDELAHLFRDSVGINEPGQVPMNIEP